MRALFSVIALMFTSSIGAAELPAGYAIDDFIFQWTVYSGNERAVRIRKDESKTQVVIAETGMIGDSIYMSPETAVEIGQQLAKSAEMRKKFGDQKDVSEKVEAGNYVVNFSTNKDGEFYIYIRSNERFSTKGIILSLKQANGLVRALSDSVKLAAYVDEKINVDP